MLIVFGYSESVKQYQTEYEDLKVARPKSCPQCQADEQMIGHGSYRRKVRDRAAVYWIRVRRWLCKACKRTISALPDLVLLYRWYITGVVQEILTLRYGEEMSWREIEEQIEDAPHLRTMQRWCRAFEAMAVTWLAWIARVLAEQDSRSVWLEQGGGDRSGERLLSGAMHLLEWARGRWRELQEYGLTDWLRFLWVWGWEQGLGRPV
jgi:transposase-like protein